MGLNPGTKYWIYIFNIHLVEKKLCLFVKTQINEKDAGNGHFKEIVQRNNDNVNLFNRLNGICLSVRSADIVKLRAVSFSFNLKTISLNICAAEERIFMYF